MEDNTHRDTNAEHQSITCEIMEDEKIDWLQAGCVSTPSVSLSEKEFCFLRRV